MSLVEAVVEDEDEAADVEDVTDPTVVTGQTAETVTVRAADLPVVADLAAEAVVAETVDHVVAAAERKSSS